jgi:hypothetical protein
MKDIFDKYAALRAAYPDDESIARIEAEEKSTRSMLKMKAFSELETTQELMAPCRRDIVAARYKLASTRDLPEEARQALWAVVDSRQWFLEMVAQDFEQQLEQVQQELEAALSA